MNTGIEIFVALCAAAATFVLMHWAASRVLRMVGAAALAPEPTALEEESSLVSQLLRRWAKRLQPYIPERVQRDLARQIVRAGGLSGLTPAQVVLYGLLATALAIALGLLLTVATGWPAWLVIMGCVVCAVMPFIWLRDQVQKRHLDILADLPFHLDLLTLCVEAGLDFAAGVMKMVDKGRAGPLRDEFVRFLGELRIGKTRAEALEAMSERVGLQQLSSFLSALIQADRMGTGLARTLRAQAEQLRVERFQRAETKAGEAPVKMLLPLVLFIFPTIWIILAAPLIFDWVWRGAPW